MVLTADQTQEFERFLQEEIAGVNSAPSLSLVAWALMPVSQRLTKFKEWSAAERTRETKHGVDVDDRVLRDKDTRATRDTTLTSIDTLTRL